MSSQHDANDLRSSEESGDARDELDDRSHKTRKCKIEFQTQGEGDKETVFRDTRGESLIGAMSG